MNNGNFTRLTINHVYIECNFSLRYVHKENLAK
jgi:hypothetical protein